MLSEMVRSTQVGESSVGDLSSPEGIVKTWRTVEARPNDNTAEFLAERDELALIKFRAQKLIDQTGDKAAYKLFKEWGIPVTFSVSRRVVVACSKVGLVKITSFVLATMLLALAVLSIMSVVSVVMKPKVQPPLSETISREYQEAQAASANAIYVNRTLDHFHNAGAIQESTEEANSLVAKFNIDREKLPETERTNLPVLPYVK